jgi:hypothetical protein
LRFDYVILAPASWSQAPKGHPPQSGVRLAEYRIEQRLYSG